MSILAGRVAVITGAESGIGRAVAEEFTREGATVVRLDKSARSGVDVYPVDVTNAEEVYPVVDAIVARHEHIDILVNSAGIIDLRPWGKIDLDHFRGIFDVNVFGMALVTQAVAPHMPPGSSIVNLSSGAGRKGNPVSVMYAASKAAVISITQSAAIAYADRGIRVNALAPGRVDSKMWDSVIRRQAQIAGTDEETKRLAQTDGVLLGRIADVSEIVQPALFLACKGSEYMTGQTINVDGGMFFA